MFAIQNKNICVFFYEAKWEEDERKREKNKINRKIQQQTNMSFN